MSNELDRWQTYLDGELSLQAKKELEREFAEKPNQHKDFLVFQSRYNEIDSFFNIMREDQRFFDVESSLKSIQSGLTVEPKTQSSWSWMNTWIKGPFGVAVAGAFVFLMVHLGVFSPDKSQKDAGVHHPLHQHQPVISAKWRVKGSPLQMLHQYKGEDTSAQTHNGTLLRPGDFVQFAFAVSEPIHLMVVSIDVKGNLSRYVPLNYTKSILLKVGKGVLPKGGAIELDDSLGPEIFVVLASKVPFTYPQLQKAFKAAYPRYQKTPKKLFFAKGTPWHVLQTLRIHKVKQLKKETR